MIIIETSEENYHIIEQSGILEKEGVCEVEIKMKGKIPHFDTFDEMYTLAHSERLVFDIAKIDPIEVIKLIQVVVPATKALIEFIRYIIAEHKKLDKEFKITINGNELSFKNYSADEIDKIVAKLYQYIDGA